MKITWMTTVVLMGGAVAYGQSEGAAAERKVTVCMDSQDARVTPGVGLMAQTMASRMFARIGVTLGWRNGFSHCPAQSLRVSLGSDTPADLKPGAFAYALPYEGTHIRVFYDRIDTGQQSTRAVTSVLAHVLVHEITHIVQRIDRHSDRGIMKARWTLSDIVHMSWKPMEFTEDDVALIYLGLTWRAAHPDAAGNGDNRTAAVAIVASR